MIFGPAYKFIGAGNGGGFGCCCLVKTHVCAYMLNLCTMLLNPKRACMMSHVDAGWNNVYLS